MTKIKILLAVSTSSVILMLLFGLRKAKDIISIHNLRVPKKKLLSRLLNKKTSFIKYLYLTSFVLTVLIVYTLFKNIILSIIFSLCLLIIIRDITKTVETNRKKRLSTQLIKLLSDISIMSAAGKSLRQIFLELPSQSERPIKIYLSEVASSLNSGQSLESAFEVFEKRTRNRDVSLILNSLKINLRLGGDLCIVLKDINGFISNELKRKNRMSTLTLQGQYSSNMIASLPLLSLILIRMFAGDAIEPFLNSFRGNLCIALGGILQIAGILSMRKITG